MKKKVILTTKYVWFIVSITMLFILIFSGCQQPDKRRDCSKPAMGTRCVTRPHGTIHCRYVNLCYEYEDLLLPGEIVPPEKMSK